MKNRLLKVVMNLFSSKKITPAELFKLQQEKKCKDVPLLDVSLLIKGAERQYARLHDPKFQTSEMIETMNLLVPAGNGHKSHY